jgi:PadR family transcriptional regulator AphA
LTLRYALLAILAIKPGSGYDAVQRFRKSAGYAWHANHSQIYPELARCLEAGLIKEVGRGKRGKRLYSTTPKGVRLVRDWLLKSSPDRAVRNEATLRSFFTWLIPDDAAVAFYRGEAAYHRLLLDELEGVRGSFPDDWREDPPLVSGRITVELGVRYERMMLDWAEWAAEQMEMQRMHDAIRQAT